MLPVLFLVHMVAVDAFKEAQSPLQRWILFCYYLAH